jgi:hypothetical protein
MQNKIGDRQIAFAVLDADLAQTVRHAGKKTHQRFAQVGGKSRQKRPVLRRTGGAASPAAAVRVVRKCAWLRWLRPCPAGRDAPAGRNLPRNRGSEAPQRSTEWLNCARRSADPATRPYPLRRDNRKIIKALIDRDTVTTDRLAIAKTARAMLARLSATRSVQHAAYALAVSKPRSSIRRQQAIRRLPPVLRADRNLWPRSAWRVSAREAARPATALHPELHRLRQSA